MPPDASAITLRPARLDEREALEALIAVSARELSRDDYRPEQVEACLGTVFGVDTDLIADGSYLVVEVDGVSAACGGWSRRKTLFGADAFSGHDSGFLDPAVDAAKIRAFFVHPAFARRGLGRRLLEACETAARAHGFKALELMGTLPGVKLYRTLGFEPGAPVLVPLKGGLDIEFVPMRKELT